MSQYKAVEAFEFEGAQVEVGQELELGEAQAAELGSKVEAVVDSSEAGATGEQSEAAAE